MTQAVPGWYDDGTGRLRWWDGAAWTGDVHVPDPARPVHVAGERERVDAAVRATSAVATGTTMTGTTMTGTTMTGAVTTATTTTAHGPSETGAVATAPADPIRSLSFDRPSSDELDPVLAWARQQASAQQQAEQAREARPEALTRGTIIEVPRRRRRALPWVLGGVLGAIVLAGAGGTVWYLATSAEQPIDEGAAEVVRAYDSAWDGGDCAQIQGVLTEAFLADNGWDDCDAWAANQRSYLMSYEEYSIDVDATVVQGDAAWVDTSERFVPAEGGEEQTTRYRYELVRDGDGWLIDALSER